MKIIYFINTKQHKTLFWKAYWIVGSSVLQWASNEQALQWARVTISTRTLINYQIFKFHIFSSHNQLQVGCFWYWTEGFLRILASKYRNFPKNNDYFRVCFRLFPLQWTPGVMKLTQIVKWLNLGFTLRLHASFGYLPWTSSRTLT